MRIQPMPLAAELDDGGDEVDAELSSDEVMLNAIAMIHTDWPVSQSFAHQVG